MAFDFGASIAILPQSFNPTADRDCRYIPTRDAHDMLPSFLQDVDDAKLLIVRPDGYVFGATRAAPEALSLCRKLPRAPSTYQR